MAAHQLPNGQNEQHSQTLREIYEKPKVAALQGAKDNQQLNFLGLRTVSLLGVKFRQFPTYILRLLTDSVLCIAGIVNPARNVTDYGTGVYQAKDRRHIEQEVQYAATFTFKR